MFSNIKIFGFLVTFFMMNFSVHSQTLNAKLLDSETQKAIPYANIQIGEEYGIISNSEGDFNLVLTRFAETDSVRFSSLGYRNKSIAIKDLDGRNIFLDPQAEELGAVFIQSRAYSGEEILEKVNKNLEENYSNQSYSASVYHRNKSEIIPTKMDVETQKAKNVLDKKTLRKFNKTIDSMASASRNNKTTTYTSILGQMALEDSLKLQLDKASTLLDREKSVDMSAYSTEIYQKLARNIESSNTFHVRTGILKVGDSVDLAKGIGKKDSDIDSVLTKTLKSPLKGLVNNSTFKSSKGTVSIHVGGSTSGTYIPTEFIKNTNDYTYNVEDIMILGDEFVYQVSFKPKRKGKYEGNLYVSTSDFGIYRTEFKLAPGEKGASFNMKMLLGIKFEESDQAGVVIYQKLNDVYQPQYIQLSGKQYAFLKRSFSMKENTDSKKERIKLKIKMTLEYDNAYQSEWLFSNTREISAEEFASFQENLGVPEQKLSKYDAALWEDENALAPTKAVREYDTETEWLE